MAAEQTDVTSQICPACGNSIDTSNAEPLQCEDCSNCGEKVQAERMFDNFLVLETVGVGGMGTVYKPAGRRTSAGRSGRSVEARISGTDRAAWIVNRVETPFFGQSGLVLAR